MLVSTLVGSLFIMYWAVYGIFFVAQIPGRISDLENREVMTGATEYCLFDLSTTTDKFSGPTECSIKI